MRRFVEKLAQGHGAMRGFYGTGRDFVVERREREIVVFVNNENFLRKAVPFQERVEAPECLISADAGAHDEDVRGRCFFIHSELIAGFCHCEEPRHGGATKQSRSTIVGIASLPVGRSQ